MKDATGLTGPKIFEEFGRCLSDVAAQAWDNTLSKGDWVDPISHIAENFGGAWEEFLGKLLRVERAQDVQIRAFEKGHITKPDDMAPNLYLPRFIEIIRTTKKRPQGKELEFLF